MRHVFIRSILTLIWLAAAIFSVVSGNLTWSAFYLILGGVCLLSAYRMWKNEKNDEGKH